MLVFSIFFSVSTLKSRKIYSAKFLSFRLLWGILKKIQKKTPFFWPFFDPFLVFFSGVLKVFLHFFFGIFFSFLKNTSKHQIKKAFFVQFCSFWKCAIFHFLQFFILRRIKGIFWTHFLPNFGLLAKIVQCRDGQFGNTFFLFFFFTPIKPAPSLPVNNIILLCKSN